MARNGANPSPKQTGTRGWASDQRPQYVAAASQVARSVFAFSLSHSAPSSVREKRREVLGGSSRHLHVVDGAMLSVTRTMLALSVALAGSSCGGATASTPGDAPAATRTDQAGPISRVPLMREVQVQHFITLPVTVAGERTVAILDTGIGLNLISKAMCERIGCEVSGEFTGRRMSGQAITLNTAVIESLTVGEVVEHDVLVGVVDIEGFFPDPRIEAFVGLPFFEDLPFTLDLEAGVLTIESEATLAARERDGSAMAVRLDRQGPALDIFADVVLADGTELEALLDTGSPGVTLHLRYAEGLGIALDGENVEVREGHDETGHPYARYFTRFDGLAFDGLPDDARDGLRVMFQEIIHDGLVGVEFTGSFVITYDLPRARVIVEPGRAGNASRTAAPEPEPATPTRYFIDGDEVDRAAFEALFARLEVDPEPSEAESIENEDGSYGGSGATYAARDGNVRYEYVLTSFVQGDEAREARSINRVETEP